MKVSSAARWAWAKTRGMMASETPAATPAARPYLRPASERDQPDQQSRRSARAPPGPSGYRGRPGRGCPRGPSRTARPGSRRSPGATGPAGDARRCRGRRASIDGPVEEPQAPGPERGHIGPAGPDVERLVDRDPGIAERQEDGQGRGHAQDPGHPPDARPSMLRCLVHPDPRNWRSIHRPPSGPSRPGIRTDYGSTARRFARASCPERCGARKWVGLKVRRARLGSRNQGILLDPEKAAGEIRGGKG